jgi:two-component system KDP operon response regulator KdpE
MAVDHPAGEETTPRILIADPDPESAAFAQEMLAAAGYEVTVAGTGSEALHYTDTDRPDLYVLDRDLPEIDGVRVARHLHRSYRVPVERILLLDSAARASHVHPQVKALVLRKPFTGVELLLAVMRQLEQYGQALAARVPRRRGRPRKGV